MEGKVNIIGNLFLEVTAGAYGKFLKLYRGDYWITISERSWRFIRNNVKLLDANFNSETDYKLTLTTNKSVKVSMHYGHPYITFAEKAIDRNAEWYNKYINLDVNEWKAFRENIPKLDKLLKRPIIFKSYNEW